MELGTPAVQQSFASSLTPSEKLRLDYLSMICSWVRAQHHSSLREPCDSLPLTNKKINQPLQELPLVTHFYVDDLLSGSATKKGAIQLVSELQEMMKRGEFSLRKWVSNDPDVLATIPEELKAVDSKHTIKDDQPVKILGIAWLSDVDKFTFTITVNETDVWTKRKVLSEVTKIFDPLGWLATSVVISKIFLQELWSHHLSWDERRATRFSSKTMENISRTASSTYKYQDPTLHSNSTGYRRTSTRVLKNSVSTSTRALFYLTSCQFVTSYLPTLTLPISETFAWSDYKITLAWLKSDPRRWQPFAANRVAQIQELTPNVHWNFMSGLENPADCGTRGIPPTKLEKCNLWFNGPDWLRSSTFPIGEFEDNPKLQEHMSAEAKRTSKLIMLNVVDATFKAEFLQNFSSWNKLKRVVAYCLRFVKNCSLSACKRRKSFLTTAELSEAEKGIVKFIQRNHFSMEVSYLSAGKQLPSTNKLIPLTPFYDDSGIIRVGGRLKNSILADSQKHPILLPKTDHAVNLSSSPAVLQAALRENFWIISARDAVRRVVRRCIPCFRNRPRFTEQIMGDLPESRVCPSSVFQRTGIDFAGPFLIRSSKGRGSRNTKCYICVFVCLATKAVHLEVVSDLTSKAFIACLKRFVARRGKPSEIFCDQGTNFYGASRDLRKEFRQLMKDAVHQFLVTDITFHFNPPSAPHFGGIWEATVKSFKFHLNRVGVTSLTFEELSTLSSQIEACLNSRPLCVLSSSPDDPCVLTPGHFLIGKALTAIPQPTVTDDLRHCDLKMKWRIVQKNLDIGDLVLIKHDNSPPLQWKLGKVTETFPGKDDCDRFNNCQVIYSQFGLAIHQNDHQAKRRFVEFAQNEIAVVPDFHKRILFSDEAHFWLNGYVNKQNCRIWSEANPQVYVETPLHPEKLTVWSALWAGGIIGPYFFKNDEGHNVTVW
ncbi:integrase catalytic domain-containing protein [Trichonephila clavipes]|nr:integrase catalytic domain-containing protein [Trichonephila clavipes]